MTTSYLFLDGIIRAANTIVQQDLVASEIVSAGLGSIDFGEGLSVTLLLDVDITLLTLIPPVFNTSAQKSASMMRLFIQHVDPGPTFDITEFGGVAGYFGAVPVLSATAGARDVLALSYDNGTYGGLWGMFTQGAPV